MARSGTPSDPEEGRLVRRMRWVAALTVGALLVVTVLVDEFGRLLVDPTFHVSEFLIGSLMGAFLLVIGVSSITSVNLPGGWVVRKNGSNGASGASSSKKEDVEEKSDGS